MTLPCTTCTLNVYDRNGTTLRGSLTGKGVSVVRELGMEGGASLSASMWETALAANPSLFRDAIVKVSTDFGAGEVEFAAFLAQVGSGTLVGAEERAAEELSPAGRGLLGLFADWRLAHEKGWLVHDLGIDNQRFFSPASGFYSDTTWATPIAVDWSADPTARAGFPAQMLDLDSSADWIGVTSPSVTSVPEGTVNWFRKQIVLAAPTEIKMWFTADNYCKVWFDAELVGDLSEDPYNWRGLADWSREVPAGTYTIAARVENAARTVGGNPIGFLLTAWALNTSGEPTTLITHTDTSWKCFDATSTPAGLTVGQILLHLRTEATARGLPSMARLTPSFTATLDSAGVAWPVVEERSWPIGESGLTIITDLSETSADISVDPALGFHAYVDKGADLSATVALTSGLNILSYTYDGEPLTGTRAVVKTTEGYVTVTDATAELTYDAREDFFESGISTTLDQGMTVALRSLEDSARDRISYSAVIVAGVEPLGGGAASPIPLVDFQEGDTIMALNLNKVAAPMVVTSITGAFPDSGGPWQWTLELESP